MKKLPTVETTRDRAVTVKSGSAVFSVPQQQSKAPAKVITMNVSGGNSKDSLSPH